MMGIELRINNMGKLAFCRYYILLDTKDNGEGLLYARNAHCYDVAYMEKTFKKTTKIYKFIKHHCKVGL